jgi:hypothetical protein
MSELNSNDYDSEILNNIDEDMNTRQNDLNSSQDQKKRNLQSVPNSLNSLNLPNTSNTSNTPNSLNTPNTLHTDHTDSSSKFTQFLSKYKELFVLLFLFMVFASPQLCNLVCSLLCKFTISSDTVKCVLNIFIRSLLFVIVYYFLCTEMNKKKKLD